MQDVSSLSGSVHRISLALSAHRLFPNQLKMFEQHSSPRNGEAGWSASYVGVDQRKLLHSEVGRSPVMLA